MRRFFTLATTEARANCLKALAEAPEGTRVQFDGPKRSHEQKEAS